MPELVRLGSRGGIEECSNGRQPGDAVGHGVMDLDQQADPVFREARKEPHLPERS